MTLPSVEDWNRVLQGETPQSPLDGGVIKVPLNPILCKDWLSSVPVAAPGSHPPFFLKDDVLYQESVAEGNQFTGKGCFKYPKSKVFSGEFRDGRRHGPGIEWVPEPRFHTDQFDGTFGSMHVHVGHWDHNVRQGPGTRFYSNGSVYEGDYKAGLPHGKGVLVTPNGMTYDGEWAAGLMCGRGISCWKDDRRYSGQWKGGACHGHGVMRWPDDTVYKGQFEQGVPHGQGVLTTPEGLVLQGTWRHGQRAGSGTVQSLDKTVYDGDWEGELPSFLPTTPKDGTPQGSEKPRTPSMKKRFVRWFHLNGSDPVTEAPPSPRSLVASLRATPPSSPSAKSKRPHILPSSDGCRVSPTNSDLVLSARGYTEQSFVDPELFALWSEVRQPIRLDHSELLAKVAHLPIPDTPAIPVHVILD